MINHHEHVPVWLDTPINKKLKILFWDDLAETLQKNLFTEINKGLEKYGWTTVITTKKEETKKIALEKNFDAVVLDLLEDGKPIGLEILQELKNSKPFLPVVIFSIASEMDYVQSAMRGDVSYYLTKPIKSYHDIIRAIEVAIEREKAKKKLIHDRYYASIGNLAASVGHFIKNSLWNIGSRTQFLLEKTSESDESYNLLQTIQRRCNDANKVVVELLNFARREKESSKLTELDVVENINDILEMLSHELDYHKISVIKHIDGKETKLKGNEFYLKEAFLNLIKNAIEAMPNGGTLTVEITYIDRNLKITIHDTGVGMSNETLNNLFIPFYTTKPNAIGYGLFETQKIVKDHGGKIYLRSELEKGTTVILEFPQNNNSRETKG